MNVRRIVLGGLLGGVVINVSEGILQVGVLMDDYLVLMERYGITETSWAPVGYLGGAFALAFVTAWLYAAIRPRFGAGPKTGAVAGAVVWIASALVPTVWFLAWGLTLGAGLTLLILVWTLVEMVLAGVVAGWAYREGDAVA